jgi:glycosyltransferase involved in cell wall biosynthesis
MGHSVSVMNLKGAPELQELLSASGVNVITDNSNKSIFFQLKYLSNILNKFDVIHAHLPRAELISRIASKRTKLVVSRHNAEPFFPGAPKILSRMLSKFVIHKASAVIVISEAVGRFMIKNREIKSFAKIETIYYGFPNSSPMANQSQYKNLSIAQFDQNCKFVIGTVARLAPQKDIPTLLKAFEKFLKIENRAFLLIVGDGPIKEDLRSLARSLEIEERVIWYGRTNDVLSVISSMDLFVLSSLYEGFGLVLLEAISQSVPILASDNSAIPEVLGANSPSLFKTSDDDELFRLMTRVYRSEDFRKDILVSNGARLEKFSQEIMAKRIEATYERVLR